MAMSKPDSMRIWGVQFAMFPWCMQILLLIFCWKWNKDKVREEKRKGKRSGKDGDCFFGWACQPVRLERPKGEILCSLLFFLWPRVKRVARGMSLTTNGICVGSFLLVIEQLIGESGSSISLKEANLFHQINKCI